MNEPHLTEEELSLYVIGGLDAAASQRVEAHAASCEGCAQELEREARLEVQLGEVARAVSRRRKRGSRIGMTIALAVAATLVGIVLWSAGTPAPQLPQHEEAFWIVCPDPTSEECVRAAARSGFAALELGAAGVPRYEDMNGVIQVEWSTGGNP